MKLKLKLKDLRKISLLVGSVIVLIAFLLLYFHFYKDNEKLKGEKLDLTAELQIALEELEKLKNEDQYKINQQLTEEIKNINETYKKAVLVYEDLLSFKEKNKTKPEMDELFAEILSLLSEKNYTSASAKINELDKSIEKEIAETVGTVVIPAQIPSNNEAPNSGF